MTVRNVSVSTIKTIAEGHTEQMLLFQQLLSEINLKTV